MRQNNRCLCSYSFRRAQVLGLLVIEALFSTILMKENILPGAVPEFQNIRFLKKQIMPLHCIEYNIILKSVQLKAHNLNDRKITFSS